MLIYEIPDSYRLMSDALLANYHVVQMAFGLLFGAFGKFRLSVAMEFWKLVLAYYSQFCDFVAD